MSAPAAPSPAPLQAVGAALPPWRRALEVALFLALLLTPIWGAGPFPTVDGPEHLLGGWLLVHLHDPGRGWDQFLTRVVPFSSGAFEALVAGFVALGAPLRSADKCALTITLGLEAFALHRLVVIAQGPRSPWRWLAWVFPFCGTFYLGLVNFELGVGVGLLTAGSALALLLDARAAAATPWRRFVPIGVGLFVGAQCHGFAAAITGLLVGLLFLGAAPRPRLPPLLGRLLVVSLPTLGWLELVAITAGKSQHTPLLDVLRFDPGSFHDLVRTLFETPYRTVLAPNLVAALLVILCLRAGLLRPGAPRALATSLAVLLVLQPFVPDSIEAWLKLRVRFPSWIVATAIAGAAVPELSPRARSLVSAACLAVAALTAFFVTVDNRRLAALQREFESGIGQVASSAGPPLRRFYIHPDADHPLRRGETMATNLFTLYSADEGGVFSATYSGRREAHPLGRTERFAELEPPGVKLLPGARMTEALEVKALAWQGLRFDEVLGWDMRPKEIAAFERDGYVRRFQHAGLVRLAPPRRRLELTVGASRGEGARRAMVLVDDEPWVIAEAPLVAGPDGALRATLAPLPARRGRLVVLGAAGPLFEAPIDLTAADVALER